MKKYKVTVDGQEFTVSVEELVSSEHPEAGIKVSRSSKPAISMTPEQNRDPKLNKPTQRAGGIKVEAPMPGSIIAIAVNPGESIREGDVLLTLEAMKMENEITAPRSGVIGDIYAGVGDKVGSGEPLLEII